MVDKEVMESPRVRAWVLGTSENPQETAAAIEELIAREMKKPPGERRVDLIIVRADTIKGSNSIIVPVDAADATGLKDALTEITNAGLVIETVFEVRDHYPNPPHNASTFVTARELDLHPAQEFSPAGRHPNSPGRNAWG